MDIAWERPDANFEKARDLAAGAEPLPNDLIVLPEMFDSGFSLHTDTTADTKGDTLAFLRDLARSTGAFVQGARTVLESGDDLATNRASIVSPSGELLAEYAKIHPFSFGREPEKFRPGTDILTYAWTAPDARDAPALEVCPAVCYDLRFPELFRAGLRKGAHVFALGANWPAERHAHWRALLIARAIENQAFVLGVNRAGADPHLQYAGGSMAVDPKGEILGELGEHEAVLTVEIKPTTLHDWRKKFPAWQDRRL